MIESYLDSVAVLGGLPDRRMVHDLLARYREPHRHYHTVRHLASVLSHVNESDGSAVARLAVWYHDAVYDPLGNDNEDRSARLAAQELSAQGLPAAVVSEVERLVRLTATHDPAADDRDGAVVCDADLAVLASPPDAYAAYAAAVRAEYAHLDEDTFRAGRAAVLRRLLSRPALFSSAPAPVCEVTARANLAGELAGLSAPGGGAAPPR